MINFRLVGMVQSAKEKLVKIIGLNVGALLMQGLFLLSVKKMIDNNLEVNQAMWGVIAAMLGSIILKNVLLLFRNQVSTRLSNEAKKGIRNTLQMKLFELGPQKVKHMNQAEVGQLMTEGIDQFELYFGSFVPQFFYAFIAPIILSAIVSFYSRSIAIWLLVCVPLIPIAIMVVQKIAKKLLSKYWSSYTQLGDNFLDRVKGMKTLKVFDVDQQMQEKMDEEAELFRKATMRVLIMQLNSISIMDWVAYGGASGAVIQAILAFNQGTLSFGALVFITLIAAEFFIPMRQLGSFFHVAMNGAQASKRIFEILDTPTPKRDQTLKGVKSGYKLQDLSVSYEGVNALDSLNVNLGLNQMVGIVGASGSGKSTLISVLSGMNDAYNGCVQIDNVSLNELAFTSLYDSVVYVGSDSYVFKGTLYDNIAMGSSVDIERVQDALRAVKLDDLLDDKGLEYLIEDGGNNLSYGQKQRICLARCFVKEYQVYLLDEIASGVDLESEVAILHAIQMLRKDGALVVLVSHRLKSVENCDAIMVMEQGRLVGMDTHSVLMNVNSVYRRLVDGQQPLEQFAFQGGVDHEA